MKIVVLGANGQVASEVTLLLHGLPGVEVVPVSRTRNGSAFLRSRGVAVFHGSPTDPIRARAMFRGADVVANFALTNGIGRAVVRANDAISQSTIDHTAADTKLVFFSTLAIRGVYGPSGERWKNSYGDLKERNERYFAPAAARSGRSAWILRLGHVTGELQNITHLIREELSAGDVVLQDPERASNTSHVVAIAESLLAIAEGRSGPPGRWDLVSSPQWSWREVYAHEASLIGRPLSIRRLDAPRRARQPIVRRWVARSMGLVDRTRYQTLVERALARLPGSIVDRIRVDNWRRRARAEIGVLAAERLPPNEAAWWPALELSPLPGVRETRGLIEQRVFDLHANATPWPADLEA